MFTAVLIRIHRCVIRPDEYPWHCSYHVRGVCGWNPDGYPVTGSAVVSSSLASSRAFVNICPRSYAFLLIHVRHATTRHR